jgi:cytidine deaminase
VQSSENSARGAPPPGDAELLSAARSALAHAWSPYSGVRVGAALVAADGRVFTGCNVENASLGLTLCAERTALVKAVSEGVREFTVVAIATDREHGWLPCGACRQSLHEFAPGLRVVVQGRADEPRILSLAELLPSAIGPADLSAGGDA